MIVGVLQRIQRKAKMEEFYLESLRKMNTGPRTALLVSGLWPIWFSPTIKITLAESNYFFGISKFLVNPQTLIECLLHTRWYAKV